MKGIDVSRWQGSINWNAVRYAGIEFAIIKAGGSDYGFYKDPYFEANYSGAKAAGIHVGTYYFVGPGCTSAADGKADAERFIAQLVGKQFDFPVYIDFEAPNAANRAGNTDACIAFCETMEAAGYYVGIYASDYSGFKDKLDKKRLLPYTWWVAHYGASKPDYATENAGVFQYSSSGSVAGIRGRVDMNECYADYSKTIIAGGYNGYVKGQKAAPAAKPAAQPAHQSAAAPAKKLAKPKITIPVEKQGVYRLYNPNSGEHVFTAEQKEAQNLADAGWTYEGIGWHETGNIKIYRMYANNEHVYLKANDEYAGLDIAGWKGEKVAFLASDKPGDGLYPVFRLYNKTGGHHMYTISENERDTLVKAGWKLEGIAFYEHK